MSRSLLLAGRYLRFYRGRTLLLFSCILLTFLLPLSIEMLVRTFGEGLVQRAAATPLVVGAKSSRFDLVLNGLYFRGRVPQATSMAEVEAVAKDGRALAIPILCRRTAQGFPVVGTSHDYYDFRDLRTAQGTLPLILGDVCVGSAVAEELGLQVGGTLMSDRGSLYDLTAGYPLRARVAGILRPTGGPDDQAVFCDIKTAWIIEGIGHGHQDAAQASEDTVLRRDPAGVVLNAAVVEYEEITAENLDAFHFHGEPESLPVTAILVVPSTEKDATLLKGRYRVDEDAQLLVPREVVDEMLGFVFRLKAFFDANVLVVGLATMLFLVLVSLLTLRLRQRELQTYVRLGSPRGTVAKLFLLELGLTIGAGLIAAAGLGFALVGVLESRFLM